MGMGEAIRQQDAEQFAAPGDRGCGCEDRWETASRRLEKAQRG
jgi:hypothetical protein